MLHRLRHPQARERGEEKMARIGLAYDAYFGKWAQPGFGGNLLVFAPGENRGVSATGTNLPPSGVGISPSSL
jgi:hypothetical protein